MLANLRDILESRVLQQLRNELQAEELGVRQGQDRARELVTLVENIQERLLATDQIDLLVEVCLIQLLDWNALTLPLLLECLIVETKVLLWITWTGWIERPRQWHQYDSQGWQGEEETKHWQRKESEVGLEADSKVCARNSEDNSQQGDVAPVVRLTGEDITRLWRNLRTTPTPNQQQIENDQRIDIEYDVAVDTWRRWRNCLRFVSKMWSQAGS